MKGRILLTYLIIFIHKLNGDDFDDSSSSESGEDELSNPLAFSSIYQLYQKITNKELLKNNFCYRLYMVMKMTGNSNLLTTTVHDDDKLQVDELTTNTGDHQTIYHIKDLDLKVVVMKQPHDVCLMYKYTNTKMVKTTGQLQRCLYRVTQQDQYSSMQMVKRICGDRYIQFLELLIYELNTSNYYDPLTHNSTFESITSNAFSPLKASSPKGNNSINNNTSKSNKSKNRTNSSNVFNIPKKQNLRILTLNCRSIKDKTSEFSAAVNYIKPDIICGTESWLKGEHPGKNPTKDAIKSSEVFPENYTAYRNDRGTLGGGVFILVQNDIIAIEKPEFVTKCEIEWVKIQMKDKKDLTIGSFYMPHRNMEHIKELDKSLDHISNKNQTIILTGDFNCPDINWNTMSVNQNAQDKEIQRALMEVIISHSLTQIHETPTRGNNLLDIVLTSNPSLIKTSSNAPGISDHDMIVTDCDTKPHYQSKKPRKCYIYSKAKWEDLHKDLTILSTNIIEMYHTGATVQELWDKFKTDLYSNLDNHIPSKLIRSKTSLPWINHKIRKMFKKKTRLYQQAKKTNNWTNYRHFQKECKRQIRKAEYNYINTTILEGLENNNSNPSWKYVKSRKQDNIGIALLKSNGHLINDSKGKAELLIKQFSSVFTRYKDKTLPTTSKHNTSFRHKTR
ncbi:unnamed protein product [Mytilus edulis]|uniref:Endonuclease/exonuclease/phosphatase domain-containing protein n=1 Tax=Mytilus edulis TaxID=6550 RepID=A0A8S3VCZ7_MYTED|nr:unnamed protein product [Mytilus edulis]